MAELIKMPRLSDTMTEGVIASWGKNVGDKITKGDLLAEIETDKAVQELESYQNGFLLYKGAEKGGKILVNNLLCIIGKQDEDITSYLNMPHSQSTPDALSTNLELGEVRQPVETKQSKQLPNPNILTQSTPQQDVSMHPQASIDLTQIKEVILMPRLSDTMTEGVIAAWHKNIGDTVQKGDVLAEIETDKATMDLESYKTGILLYQGASKGQKIAVNDLLCIVGDKNFNIETIVNASKHNNQPSATHNLSVSSETQNQPVKTAVLPSPESNGSRIFASPLAKKIAAENQIGLDKIQGTGDLGRIVKQDVETFIKEGPKIKIEIPILSKLEAKINPSAQPDTFSNKLLPQPQTLSNNSPFTDTPVSQMRKVIAQRLAESKFSAPHFYLTLKINMDAIIEARTQLNQQLNLKISYNDIILKACALALKKHPKVNSSWRGDFIRQNHEVHIGVAVAVEDGLLVPVVRNANFLSIADINKQVKALAQKAQERKLQPKDWEGNTFTISNLGMFGIEEFTAIINPPDACILAVGGIIQEPIVKNNSIAVGYTMKVTLSCDHRVVDGASGSAFLQTVKTFLEQPLSMLVI
ncbi:MAG: pyruvate dehydrogenase complex dihydrolipoamide acetyltransferase [Alphaproteobacteria bacterium]|nr:pyruvate dehydrogenase complex dihydrolipoamide acetyltransferase [Alphaproteobacteria bacterium]